MSMDSVSLGYLTALSDFFNAEKILLLFLCIALLLFASKAIKVFSDHLRQKLPSRRILIAQVTTILNFFIHLGGSFYIFYGVLKPPQELMIAFLGSATFAVGLALKDLVASLISGITIIMDPPFQVGDRVRFKEVYGEIKHVGLRAVRLQTLDMSLVTIPNLIFVNEAVVCANKGKLNLNVITKFHVCLSNDMNLVQNVLKEVIITSKYAYLEEPINIIIDIIWHVDVLCFEVSVNAHVIDARYEKAYQSDIYVRGTKALSDSSVTFPRQKNESSVPILNLANEDAHISVQGNTKIRA